MMLIRIIFTAAAATIISSGPAEAGSSSSLNTSFCLSQSFRSGDGASLSSGLRSDEDFRRAMDLYDRGMYGEAQAAFEALPSQDFRTLGMALLCKVRSKTEGYGNSLDHYSEAYPYSGLLGELWFRDALNKFDLEDYEAASASFSKVKDSDIQPSDRAELAFKRGYSEFQIGDLEGAGHDFGLVLSMPRNNFTAPSQYQLGYLNYDRKQFAKAIPYFEAASGDQRFAELSNYYIMECHFMLKDYAYVTSHGAELYGKVPVERKSHLARIISESYLVEGDAETAKEYYDNIKEGKAKDRGDYFYAGSLLYTLKDWQGAVDNFSMMTDRSDSLGQLANYEMAYSYIQTKNKVAAAKAFKDASKASYSSDIQKDAFYNYAKLSFDLNNDPAPFKEYMEKYNDGKANDEIYSYMAMTALYNHDYAAAVEAYDQIETLAPSEQGNYMKAYYLRAKQLIDNGNYSAAVPCLKAAAYYADKHSGFGQLSRYWLSEARYRARDYEGAREGYNELYNLSALDGGAVGDILPYNIAYCYFKQGKYDMAAKWFTDYIDSGTGGYVKDAMVRKADCSFIQRKYKDAIAQYDAVLAKYPDPDDVYPYYQDGIAYGLTGDKTKKASVLSAVLKASPESAFYSDALYELGRTYMSMEESSKAVDVFRELRSSTKDSSFIARADIGLGMVANNQKKYDAAIEYYKRVVSEAPKSEFAEDAIQALQSIYQAKGEPEEYLAYVDGLDSVPKAGKTDREKVYFNSAEQIFLSGNWQKALAALNTYEEKYPEGADIVTADFYTAESHRQLGNMEQARDFYKKVADDGSGSFAEVSALRYADICYALQEWQASFDGYVKLEKISQIAQNKHVALLGAMKAAYGAKGFVNAISYADKVLLDKASTSSEKRLAEYIKAKSYLSRSERDKAFELFTKLSRQPKTPEGAEAAYLLIQDAYDQGDFSSVENKTFAFSDSGSAETYWLAKAFIVLGDSYVERGDTRQARATFESVRDGYTSTGTGDDVPDAIAMRLKKLDQMDK